MIASGSSAKTDPYTKQLNSRGSMTSLDRKMLRDHWKEKGQAVANALVMSCGIATFVLSCNMLHSLVDNLSRPTEDTRSPRLCRGMIPRGMMLFRGFPDINSF